MVKRKGLSDRRHQALLRDDVYRFLQKPAIAFIGMYVVGVIVQSFLGIKGALFPAIFSGIGCSGFLVVYYKKELGL
mgnify:FL=1